LSFILILFFRAVKGDNQIFGHYQRLMVLSMIKAGPKYFFIDNMK